MNQKYIYNLDEYRDIIKTKNYPFYIFQTLFKISEQLITNMASMPLLENVTSSAQRLYQPSCGTTCPALRWILGWSLASIHGLVLHPRLVLYIYFISVYLSVIVINSLMECRYGECDNQSRITPDCDTVHCTVIWTDPRRVAPVNIANKLI